MRKLFLTSVFLAGANAAFAQPATLGANNQTAPELWYKYELDLTNPKNDLLEVSLLTPKLGKKDSAVFALPRMVPGTYSVYDFSRFVSEFKAFNARGKELKVVRSEDGQSWKVKKPSKLAKITYKIEDTWDTDKTNFIFEPAGTNIDPDKVFVINPHGIFGYFKGREFQPLHLTISHPERLYGGTSLSRDVAQTSASKDVFIAKNYHELVDNPIMYALPDTAWAQIGNAKVLIHTYSPTGKVKSKDLMPIVAPLLKTQIEYLGKIEPTDLYSFLIFLNEEGKGYKSGAMGALEHNTSSFYCLAEGEANKLAKGVRDIAAHEYFHTVTPLLIASEEVKNFDFANPKMSKHLWLYEGCTEYFAKHVQVKNQLTSQTNFLNEMSKKLRTSKSFNDKISFTEMSKTCLDLNKNQYMNVYMKGALIGMCLDLLFVTESNGKTNLVDLMQHLATKYGKNVPFKDEELFKVIAEFAETKTSPAGAQKIANFLAKNVDGIEPLPYKELLEKAGVTYLEEGEAEELSKFGLTNLQKGFAFDFKEKRLKIASAEYIDDFGKNTLQLQPGDLLKSWNGKELDMNNVSTILGLHEMNSREGDEIEVGILRKQDDGSFKEIVSKGIIKPITVKQKHIFQAQANPSAEQINVRKAWLGQ